MDESISCLIRRASELARNLEASYHNNQPDDVVLSCIDEIVETLNGARERLVTLMASRDEALKQELTTQQPQMQEWVSRTYQMIQMQHQQLRAARNTTPSRGTLQIGEMGGREGSSERSRGSEGDVEASPSRRRKRKDDAEKRTVTVPAPQYGNTEMPPEDGYTWRKYGQKEILGSNYPRAYYRCTHQKLYECPAKKQVQRLDSNPSIFAVTYRGEHTCYKSPTAPSSSVPPQLLPLDISHDNITPHTTTPSSHLSPSSTSASVSQWLSSSVHLSLLGGGGVAPAAPDGGSTSRFAGADYPVADMADAMFNSGSSSGNSMESLFPPAEAKWETGDKKS